MQTRYIARAACSHTTWQPGGYKAGSIAEATNWQALQLKSGCWPMVLWLRAASCEPRYCLLISCRGHAEQVFTVLAGRAPRAAETAAALAAPDVSEAPPPAPDADSTACT